MLTLLLVVIFLQCGRSEKAPLYIFITKRDILELTSVASDRVDFVKNGEITLQSLTNNISARSLAIPPNLPIFIFSLLMCRENVTVNYTWTSMNTNILGNPLLSIPSSLVLPTCPFRIFSVYPCNSSAVQEGQIELVLTKFTIITYSHDKEYDPIVMYLYKQCNSEAPPDLIGATEFPSDPSDYVNVSGNAGCYNDTDLPKTIIKKRSTGINSSTIVAAVVVPIVIIIIVIVITIFLIRFYRHRRIVEFTVEMVAEAHLTGNPLYDKVADLRQPGPHEKEFSSDNITFVRELGEGAFGRVYQGIAGSIVPGEESTVVAVKQLKVTDASADDGAALVEFFKEVAFMSKLDHPRIVKLLGVCTLTEPHCMMFEYMDLGDLNSYLRSAIGLGPDCDEVLNKETCFLQLGDLLSIVEQIAEGMEYLSSQNLVHRDLATRNCLVATGLVVKIADFGLSRDVNSTDYYRVRGRAVLPIRWMAPESIMYGKFTTATDVWSFGVVMWEVFTYGQQPYFGLTNEEVIKFVAKQGTLEPPNDCPQKVTKIMAQCWSQSPGSRPSFSKLFTSIQQLPSILKDITFDTPVYPELKLN